MPSPTRPGELSSKEGSGDLPGDKAVLSPSPSALPLYITRMAFPPKLNKTWMLGSLSLKEMQAQGTRSRFTLV